MKWPASNRRTAIAAAAACLVLIICIAVLTAKTSTDVLARPSTFFTDSTGARAMYLIAQRTLPVVEQWRLPITELKLPASSGATLIAMAPDTFGQDEARALDQWVAAGGQLILASNTDWHVQRSARDRAVQDFLVRHDITPGLPKGSLLALRGQVETMNSSFIGLGLGILFAIALVYLLMAVNFQSWLDRLIILMALPGALSGIVWMLFVTQTTFSVPSLMGTIMAIGVATANSILLVTFANDERAEGKDALAAALSAGFIRLRPVVMTALAMIIGMLPMALGFGEGGEQNAPLGRAVIGGLLVATVTTLFFVPIMYSYLRKKPPLDLDRQIEEEYHEGDVSPEFN